jgi:glycosyltransferase involved in cell wall biosynthesis
MTPTLSVVMPVHNEAAHLLETIEALDAAIERSDFEAELILVDDGSTDGSAVVARDTVGERLSLRLLSQPNLGRLAARSSGVHAARAEFVLLLDGRVRIDSDALVFARSRVKAGERVWTGHVRVDAGGNLYGIFWLLLAELAWFDYFRQPRTVSFGAEDFDRYPKGTTCLLAPRKVLVEAIAAYRTRYADPRQANDDTPLIRWIAEHERIHISPHFGCDYRPRTTLSAFLRHSFHRGVVFVDGHGRRESRFFPVVAAFYPANVLLVLAVIRRPVICIPVAAVSSLAAVGLGVARRRRPRELASLALLTPVYALAHGAGMWRGLAMLVDSRIRDGRRRAARSDSRPAPGA